jgi:hypothetical protein
MEEKSSAIKWWADQAEDEFRQAVFSELYVLYLFVEEPLDLAHYYLFKSDDQGDAVWLNQRNEKKQEYELLRVPEARKVSPSQPACPVICKFWHDISIDVHQLARTISVKNIEKKMKEGGKTFAQEINRYFVAVLETSSVDNKVPVQNKRLDDVLAEVGDELSGRSFTADRFLFQKDLQGRLIQRNIIIPDDELPKVSHYVGKTKTGLYAFWSSELSEDTALVFDSTVNMVITQEPEFRPWIDHNDPFLKTVRGTIYLNPIVKNVQSVIALEGIEDALAQVGRGEVKQAKDEIMFVDLDRIEEMRAITSSSFDLVKLIELCEELNTCYANDCFLAVTMLTRCILDHIPPIFGYQDFNQVANNYGGRSFKKSMQHLQNSSRNIADFHLHQPIRDKESLPSRVQVNFSNDLDVLLAEIVRVLK